MNKNKTSKTLAEEIRRVLKEQEELEIEIGTEDDGMEEPVIDDGMPESDPYAMDDETVTEETDAYGMSEEDDAYADETVTEETDAYGMSEEDDAYVSEADDEDMKDMSEASENDKKGMSEEDDAYGMTEEDDAYTDKTVKEAFKDSDYKKVITIATKELDNGKLPNDLKNFYNTAIADSNKQNYKKSLFAVNNLSIESEGKVNKEIYNIIFDWDFAKSNIFKDSDYNEAMRIAKAGIADIDAKRYEYRKMSDDLANEIKDFYNTVISDAKKKDFTKSARMLQVTMSGKAVNALYNSMIIDILDSWKSVNETVKEETDAYGMTEEDDAYAMSEEPSTNKEKRISGGVTEQDDEDELPDSEVNFESISKEILSRAKATINEGDYSAKLKKLIASDKSLSEKFKANASVIFEAAVSEKLARVSDAFESALLEQLKSHYKFMVEKVDGYLTYAVESMIEKNQDKVDSKLRTDIAESFIADLKEAFEKNYIEMPENKTNVLAKVSKENRELSEKGQRQAAKINALNEKLVKLSKEKIIREASEGLYVTQIDRLKKLTENVEFVDEKTFANKVKVIRETYFSKVNNGKSEKGPTPVQNTVVKTRVIEDTINEESDSVMGKYVAAISKHAKR